MDDVYYWENFTCQPVGFGSMRGYFFCGKGMYYSPQSQEVRLRWYGWKLFQILLDSTRSVFTRQLMNDESDIIWTEEYISAATLVLKVIESIEVKRRGDVWDITIWLTAVQIFLKKIRQFLSNFVGDGHFYNEGLFITWNKWKTAWIITL